jgi:hypothetical protein
MVVVNYVCGLDLESSSTLLIISAFRGTCQGLIFSMYVIFWVLDVSKLLDSPQQVLRWIVARAHLKWEELGVAPRPPLDLTISRNRLFFGRVIFSFDKALEEDDNDEGVGLLTHTR